MVRQIMINQPFWSWNLEEHNKHFMFSFVPKKLKKSLNNYQNTTKLIKQHSQDVAGLTYFNRSTNFNLVNVTIDSIVGSKQPEMHNPNRFYKIYSP